MSKELRFLQITAKHQDFFYHIYNDKNFIPKYPNNALIDSVYYWTIGEKSSREQFCRHSSQCREILLQVK